MTTTTTTTTTTTKSCNYVPGTTANGWAAVRAFAGWTGLDHTARHACPTASCRRKEEGERGVKSKV